MKYYVHKTIKIELARALVLVRGTNSFGGIVRGHACVVDETSHREWHPWSVAANSLVPIEQDVAVRLLLFGTSSLEESSLSDGKGV